MNEAGIIIGIDILNKQDMMAKRGEIALKALRTEEREQAKSLPSIVPITGIAPYTL